MSKTTGFQTERTKPFPITELDFSGNEIGGAGIGAVVQFARTQGADATLVFCYSLCLGDSLLRRLRQALEAQLRLGALVLLRGGPLPPPEEAVGGRAAATRLELVMRTRIVNREWQYYGYRVVHGPAPQDAPPEEQCCGVLQLEQTATRLGGTRFEKPALGPPEPDDGAEHALWALLESDIDEVISSGREG